MFRVLSDWRLGKFSYNSSVTTVSLLHSHRCCNTRVIEMSAKAHAFQHACRTRLLLADTRLTNTRSATTQIRRHASSNPGASRRAITVTSDDGRYAWSELSTGEKAARTTQQSFNFLLVGAGVVATVRKTNLILAQY